MAALSLDELRKRPGRIETFVNKLKNKTPFDMVTGDSKVFTKVAFTDSGRVIEVTPSKDPRQIALAIEWLKTRATNSRYVLVMNDKERFTLSDLLKNGDFGGQGGKTSKGAVKGNRGDMAEAIFAAAIAARFVNKNATISEQDVLDMIGNLSPNKTHQVLEFPSPNKNPKITDKVTLSLRLAQGNLTAVTDKSTQSTLGSIIQSSVKYANSNVVANWSKLLFENNRYNDIAVIADGLSEQKTSKVDVRVKIDGNQTDINVSLKADDVKQFGQISGSGFEKQKLLWDTLLNFDVSKYEKKYYDRIKEQDALGAIELVYRGVVSDFNKISTQNKTPLVRAISKGIRFFATLHEPNVTLVQLSKQEAQVYQFDNLEKLLSSSKLKATYAISKALPEMYVSDENNNVLFYVRVKREIKPNGTYIRNYIEKGALLKTLASYMAK
jgi:hypothetical protein